MYNITKGLNVSCDEVGILESESGWNVYITENDVTLNTICYVDAKQEIDDDTDEETFPEFIVNNGLEFNYTYDDLVRDVIHNALIFKKDVTNEELIKTISLYRV